MELFLLLLLFFCFSTCTLTHTLPRTRSRLGVYIMKNYGAVWPRCSNAFNHRWCFRCLQSDDHSCGNRLLALLQRGLQDQKCQWEWNQQKERGSYDPFWIMENLLPRRYLISHLLPLFTPPLPFSLPLPTLLQISPLYIPPFSYFTLPPQIKVAWVSFGGKEINKQKPYSTLKPPSPPFP